MLTLAEKAGVSLVTPYNLFGSKSSILLEIVRTEIYERISDVEALSCDSLAGWVAALSAALADIYYNNRHFYRRMIVTLVQQQNADTQRAALEFSYGSFENALRHLQGQGILPPPSRPRSWPAIRPQRVGLAPAAADASRHRRRSAVRDRARPAVPARRRLCRCDRPVLRDRIVALAGAGEPL